MEHEVLRRRNAVFNRIYHQSLIVYKSCVPVPIRWWMELNILLMAILALSLWGYVHITYIMSSEDCLVNITERPFPSDVILQVEVYSNTSDIEHERERFLLNMYNKKYNRTSNDASSNPESTKFLNTSWIAEYCEANFIVSFTGTKFFCQFVLSELYNSIHADAANRSEEIFPEGREGSGVSLSAGSNTSDPVLLNDYSRDNSSITVPMSGGNLSSDDVEGVQFNAEEELSYDVFSAKNRTLYEIFDYYTLQMLVLDYVILEFSQEPGYLSLTDQARDRLKIPVVKVYINPDQSTCFGGPFGQFLTKYFLGYDMMIIASFRGLLPPGHGSGYVKNLLTGNQYYYKVQWMGKWRYGAGLLPALFFTLVASVLLRQIHYHIFKFLTHFNNLLNQGIPMPIQTGAQIPFLIVTYATIGLVIVMGEALGDDSVFSLLMVGTVWEVDQFYSIYCKQETSKTYLPWFFFLYHFLPYAYYIRFNGQFWFIPFLFHWLMLQHAMLFFLHHCELPALDQMNHAPVNPEPPEAQQVDPPQVGLYPMGEHAVRQTGGLQLDGSDAESGGSIHVDSNERLDEQQIPSTSSTTPPAEGENGPEALMRSNLRRRTVNSTREERIASVPIQETGLQSHSLSMDQKQLSDEALRKARLQHFERESS